MHGCEWEGELRHLDHHEREECVCGFWWSVRYRTTVVSGYLAVSWQSMNKMYVSSDQWTSNWRAS